MLVTYHGSSPTEWRLDKIAQMRRDMHHIQMALSALEGRIRANTDSETIRPQYSTLHNWVLSELESYYGLIWAAFDRDMTDAVIKDMNDKFRWFTSAKQYSGSSSPISPKVFMK
jgi:hypothetical protein